MASHLVCTLDFFFKMVEKKERKAIFRTAIIPVLPFKITKGFETLLLKEKPQVKFISTDH